MSPTSQMPHLVVSAILVLVFFLEVPRVAALTQGARLLLSGKALKTLSSEQWTRSYFLSNDQHMCAEGSPTTVEGALALKKAGLEGWLYNNTFAQKALVLTPCNEQGYTFSAGDDGCYPGVQLFYRSQAEASAFQQSQRDAVVDYAGRWDLPVNQATLMNKCTCHPESANKRQAYMECSDALNGLVGSWVHHDPVDQSGVMCDGGPFEEAMRALAVLKSTAQLPMHQYDQIAPVTCDRLGFPHKYPEIDHCFAGLHMWTRTVPIGSDPGIQRSQAIENSLFHEDGFRNFTRAHHLNDEVLNGAAGCHCSSHSPVGEGFEPGACTNHTSPVRSWWQE